MINRRILGLGVASALLSSVLPKTVTAAPPSPEVPEGYRAGEMKVFTGGVGTGTTHNLLEDAVVIYRIDGAPVRRIWCVDVGPVARESVEATIRRSTPLIS